MLLLLVAQVWLFLFLAIVLNGTVNVADVFVVVIFTIQQNHLYKYVLFSVFVAKTKNPSPSCLKHCQNS